MNNVVKDIYLTMVKDKLNPDGAEDYFLRMICFDFRINYNVLDGYGHNNTSNSEFRKKSKNTSVCYEAPSMNSKVKRVYLMLLGFNYFHPETFKFISSLEWPKAETMWLARNYRRRDGQKN